MLIAGKAKKESPYLDHPELNGGVDDPQLAWLETVLDTCKTCGEVAIVFSHVRTCTHAPTHALTHRGMSNAMLSQQVCLHTHKFAPTSFLPTSSLISDDISTDMWWR